MENREGGPPSGGTRLDILVSSVSSDAHMWNLVFLQLLLQEWGHRVTNLGPCVPDALIVNECGRRLPDLVVVSSVNGHGFRDGLRLIGALRGRTETANVPAVIGGKLGVDAGQGAAERGAALIAAGYRAVFADDVVNIAGRGTFPAADGPRLFRALVDSVAVAAVPC